MSLSTPMIGSTGSGVPAPAGTRATDGAARGAALPGATPASRRLFKDAGLGIQPGVHAPPAADRDLFRTILSDGMADRCFPDGDGQDAGGPTEGNASRTDPHDAVARLAHAQEGAARPKQHVPDAATIAPLDVTALSAVVSKVYLDNDLNRERVVHMVLNDALLPATRLSIFERSGRLAVDFVSTNMAMRERLRRGAPTLAQRIAGDLSRDVAVRVAAHDTDRRALEVCADAKPLIQARAQE